MRIAIASGKGGTGKTTVATNLALCADGDVELIDCDVEEPNCHVFLRLEFDSTTPVCVTVPKVDEDKCSACRECSKFCEFNAIVSLGTKALTFPELCHGCGGCKLVCPEEAISDEAREVGVLEKGSAGTIRFIHGRLRIGEAMAAPLIRAVLKASESNGLTIIDAPPGTSCPVIAAIKDADFVVLVTEPTPFGLNDLTLAVETVRLLGVPFGVVINRADIGDNRVKDYCRNEGISILAEIPHDRRAAEVYSRGELIAHAIPRMRAIFENMLAQIERQARA